MKRYFKGNTLARAKCMALIHKNFKDHQLRWIFNRFARNFPKR